MTPLVIDKQDSRPYADIADEVDSALSAMRWLVGYGCSCDEESLAWEQMSSRYKDTSFDEVELKELREPQRLGQVLREYPEKFSMLNDRAHLKAWLNFADRDGLRLQAIAGARNLDHRNADAIEMLGSGREHEAWTVLEYLPELDLEATPALCAAALAQLHRELKDVYRPTADNPLPYSEMLERMGTGEPLAALIWLAQHGCSAARRTQRSRRAGADLSGFAGSRRNAGCARRVARQAIRHQMSKNTVSRSPWIRKSIW